MGIGKKLFEILEQKGVNPNELAESTGISSSTIYSIIKRDNSKIDIQALLKICKALNVKAEVFYEEYLSDQEKEKTSQSIDNRWEALRIQLSSLSDNELIELHNYVKYLYWKRNSNEEQD